MGAKPRIFISYAHDDLRVVQRLVDELRGRGAEVWFDRDTLRAGMLWRDEIRRAITEHEYFVACFSGEQNRRSRSYMNEELEQAFEEVRLRGDTPWFIPVLLSGDIPDRLISATRSLRDIQYVRLDETHWSTGLDAIALATGLSPSSSGAVPQQPPSRNATTVALPTARDVTASKPPILSVTRAWRWSQLAATAAMMYSVISFTQLLYRGFYAPTTPLPILQSLNATSQVVLDDKQKHYVLSVDAPDHGNPSVGGYRHYSLDIVELASNSVVWRSANISPALDGRYSLLLPTASFKRNVYYKLRTRGNDGHTIRTLASYTFKVSSRNDHNAAPRANFGVKLSRPGFGPTAELPTSSPA